MKSMTTSVLSVMIGIAAIGLGAIFPTISRAHCDTLDGPVVTEARVALEKGDVTPVLKWVKIKNEDEIKTVFKKALTARSSGKEAKEIADLYFFETLVRLHRAGEGAAFTGLEPAGTIEPAVAAADKAIEVGSVDELAKEIGKSAEKAVRDRFGRLTLQRNIYIIEFGLSDPSFSVRRVGNQITIKVIFNNLHYPLHTQRSERKYY